MFFRDHILLPVVIALTATGVGGAFNAQKLNLHNSQGINLWKLQRLRGASVVAAPKRRDDSPGTSGQASQTPLVDEFDAETFVQRLDHFSNTTDATFAQRFWVNKRHYKPRPSAPVIVLDGGETSGEDRLPFLDTGIADILARATGGLAVVLEHRYYGKSIGVQNLSTDSLRWLDNEQALEDSANFMRHVKFSGIKEDLTATETPWIYYGGSYAGARAAHMRVLYPDLVFGAIASSAVTHATVSDWEYMDVIRLAAEPKCSSNLVESIANVDSLLNVSSLRGPLKKLFGLEGLESDQDFVSVLATPLVTWQSQNWDPAVGSKEFDEFCASLNGNTSTLEDTTRMVSLQGGLKVNIALPNYAKWIRENVVYPCTQNMSAEDCFGTNNSSQYQLVGLDQDWRLWTFQFCTQWGFLITAPPSNTPTIISRLLDLDYAHKICIQAFPPGNYFQVPALPNVTAVNALGDYNITADRLAFIDGEDDPWRPNTPHSTYGGAMERNDTMLRPFKLIPGGVHHWDENGLRDSKCEPKEIRQIHEEMIEFVKAWLEDWKGPVAKQS